MLTTIKKLFGFKSKEVEDVVAVSTLEHAKKKTMHVFWKKHAKND